VIVFANKSDELALVGAHSFVMLYSYADFKFYLKEVGAKINLHNMVK